MKIDMMLRLRKLSELLRYPHCSPLLLLLLGVRKANLRINGRCVLSMSFPRSNGIMCEFYLVLLELIQPVEILFRVSFRDDKLFEFHIELLRLGF